MAGRKSCTPCCYPQKRGSPPVSAPRIPFFATNTRKGIQRKRTNNRKNRNEETVSRVNKQFRASNAIRDREQERIVVLVFASVKISLFSESFTREKEGAFCTRSKKAATNFSACVTKGRRGPRTTRAKKCPTESRRIPSSATRTRSSRRNRYVFSSHFFVVFAFCLTTKCILFLIIPHKQKNSLCRRASVREFFDRSE